MDSQGRNLAQKSMDWLLSRQLESTFGARLDSKRCKHGAHGHSKRLAGMQQAEVV
jgi:hypothetical protein